jgi:hypothetical protein
MLDDGQTVTHKFFELGAARIREPCDSACDRAGIGLEARQARPDLNVQLQRGAFSLVVLRRDQAMVERLILSSRSIERMRQRIEAFGNGGELLRFGGAANPVIATFEIGETMSYSSEWVEHPPNRT